MRRQTSRKTPRKATPILDSPSYSTSPLRPRSVHARALALLMVGALAGCGGGGISAPSLFESASDYDRYVSSLEGVDLDTTAMGRLWLQAGQQALGQPEDIALPFREELFFAPDRPRAASWRLELRRGQMLRVSVAPATAVFADLFALREDASNPAIIESVTEIDDGGRLEHSIDSDGVYILRLQLQLLEGGRVTVEATAGGQLTFPVDGKDASAIGSVFGDPRDGGSRSHKGVDIFAPRGTLAVAAVDGRVTRVGTNRLGGNVVWMRGGGKSFYYAHLERQLASTGQSVKAGEPIGEVGNSGNAIRTPPHLHFGVFGSSGALDPSPFLAPAGTPEPVGVDAEMLGAWGRVSGANVRLRSGPSTGFEIRDELERNTALRLEGAARGWFRARLADGRQGYISSKLVQSAKRPLRRLEVRAAAVLHHQPSLISPEIAALEQGAQVDVLAELDEHALVRTAEGAVGWLLG